MAKGQPRAKAMSRNQRIVLAELRRRAAPVTAYKLLHDLSGEGFNAPPTVYRALDALIRRGLVRRIAVLNAFIAVRADAAQSISAFIICRRCGAARERALLRGDVEALLSLTLLAPGDVFLEVFGDCDNGCDDSADCNET